MTDMNILDLFLKASLLVKLIMLILIGFSIASWAIIIQRTRILNAAAREAEAFEDKFWSGIELSRLYQESQGKRDNLTGSEKKVLATMAKPITLLESHRTITPAGAIPPRSV